MGNLRPIALLYAGVVLAGAIFSTPAPAAASFDFFYSNLSPHGEWMVSGTYGRVWQPASYRPGWNPYYDGHWQETDLGNTWVSEYEWGHIPYHYGTWAFDPHYGWVWIPGYTWAPAWVVFRTGPGYIGWSPVTPQFSVGMTIGVGDYDPNQFVFVPAQAFFQPRIRTVVVPASRTKVIINKTKIVNRSITIENNVVVNKGLTVNELERVTGRPVRSVPLERVRGLGPKVKREEIRVDSSRVKRGGLRAAEPVDRRTVAANERDSMSSGREARHSDREDPSERNSRSARDARSKDLYGQVARDMDRLDGQPVARTDTGGKKDDHSKDREKAKDKEKEKGEAGKGR